MWSVRGKKAVGSNNTKSSGMTSCCTVRLVRQKRAIGVLAKVEEKDDEDKSSR